MEWSGEKKAERARGEARGKEGQGQQAETERQEHRLVLRTTCLRTLKVELSVLSEQVMAVHVVFMLLCASGRLRDECGAGLGSLAASGRLA